MGVCPQMMASTNNLLVTVGVKVFIIETVKVSRVELYASPLGDTHSNLCARKEPRNLEQTENHDHGWVFLSHVLSQHSPTYHHRVRNGERKEKEDDENKGYALTDTCAIVCTLC